MADELIEGRWYWVRFREGGWAPAIYKKTAVGGWTNEDTWEDFARGVVDWRLISNDPNYQPNRRADG